MKFFKHKRYRIFAVILVLILSMSRPVLAEQCYIWPFRIFAETGYSGSGVRIALIDTGVSLKYIDETHVSDGKNYVFPDGSTDDLIGHGTAIAGIILGSERLGLKGIAPGAEIVPLVYYSRHISGVPANGGVDAICNAIYDAVDIYGCRIINISSGVLYDDENLRTAIAYAEEKNAVVISAVGNTNRTSPDDVYYPAAYETVIGVGSVNVHHEVAAFSQRNESVKLVAPGMDIPVVTINNRARAVRVSGSSYSAGFAAGVAALMLEANPELSAAGLREILYQSAEDLGIEGYDTKTGWGMINASEAVAGAKSLLVFNTDIIEN